ncbi:MAG: DNA polymerase-2 [Candidatus Azotimanducaceae bacterium]|jgi:DNA polymerase-2
MSSSEGFLLSRQWIEKPDGQMLVFWLFGVQGPIKVIIEPHESVFFLPVMQLPLAQKLLQKVRWRHQKVALQDFQNEPVEACYFATQKDLNTARSRLWQHNVQPLEADIRPTDRYLMERFITAGVQIDGDSQVCGGVVEYYNPRLRPAEFTPALRVISLDIETSYTENVLYSIAASGSETDLRKVFMVSCGVDAPPDELEYLEYCTSELALLLRFLAWFRVIDPDVIIGWNVINFDLRFLQQRCDHYGIDFTLGRQQEVVRWRSVTQTQQRYYVLIPGRVALDGIELLKAATYQFESFSLEYVSRSLLGRGKLVTDVDDRAAEIQDLYRQDQASLARYNLEDCVLVEEIFAHTDLIAFATERARLTGLDIDRAGGSVAAFDFLYLPRLHRAGYVGPTVADHIETGSPGGFVLDSKPGLYQDVIVLDFKSLYPSIIRTFHVDPLAMVHGEHENDAIDGFRGARFSRRHAILPGIIEHLWAARDQAKRAKRDAMSQAIKIIMNSFYGVLGTPGCRFFDLRLVSSITLRGHAILQTTRDLLESWGYAVIYGDTDSVFVWLRGEAQTLDVARTGGMLAGRLNDWWRTEVEATAGTVCSLEVEYETHFRRFLMPRIRGSQAGSKKRYAGLVVDDGIEHIVFKGLETVRSDWTPLARGFQQQLYKLMFHDRPVESFIRETVASVAAGQRDGELVLRRRLRRKLSDYQKNVPPHVKAARHSEAVRASLGLKPLLAHGGWVEYVMTINGAEPRRYQTSQIDYQFYIDKQIAPIADAILTFFDSSLARITERQLGLFEDAVTNVADEPDAIDGA